MPALATGGARASDDAIELRELRLPGAEREAVLAYRHGLALRPAPAVVSRMVRDVVPQDRVRMTRTSDEPEAVRRLRGASPIPGQV